MSAPHLPRVDYLPEPEHPVCRGRICGHTCDLWVEDDLSCQRSNCLLCPAGIPCHYDSAAWGPRPSRREYIAALLWETCAAVDGWLWWVLVRPVQVRRRGRR